MKRKAITILLFGLALSSTSYGKGLNSPTQISEIEKWIGKYPFDEVGGTEIFEMKSFKSYLRKILGEAKFKELNQIKENGPHSPVRSNQGIIYITVCQKHKCGHMFYFLLKARSEQIFICERELDLDLAADRTQGTWRVTWYGKKGKVTLPESYCEFYDEKTQEVDWSKTFALIPAQLQ